MPKIVAQTTVSETIKAPAAAKTGRQRAASHNNIGNNSAPGTKVCQGVFGSEIIIPVTAESIKSAVAPSTNSRRGGGSRAAAASPITSGAIAMIPRASDANQCHQLVNICTVGL